MSETTDDNSATLVRCLQSDAERIMMLDARDRMNDADRDAAIRAAVSLAWYLARARGWTLTTEPQADGVQVVCR